MEKIYLAGWDVFKPNAREEGEKLKALCAKYGFEGLYPLDNECESADEIYHGNIGLLKSADYVIANVNAFRGSEPDSGTAFEIGYAASMGKRVISYISESRPMIEWVKDENGFSVEDFGFPVNLMIAVGSELVIGTAEDALKKLKNC
jgi:nucleoside 2-deoxyribosyltransferase